MKHKILVIRNINHFNPKYGGRIARICDPTFFLRNKLSHSIFNNFIAYGVFVSFYFQQEHQLIP